MPQLVAYSLDKKLSGTFEFVAAGSDAARLVVDGGAVRKVRCAGVAAYLGQILFELGHVDSTGLNASLLQLSKRTALHGEILLRAGSISGAQLREALETQTCRKLHHLFSLSGDTAFSFFRDQDRLPDFGGTDFPLVDPLPTLWRGIREFPVWDHVNGTLARVGDGFCGIIPGVNLDRFAFQGAEKDAIDCLRARPMSAAELSSVGILDEGVSRLLLYCLLITKHIAFAEPRRGFDGKSFEGTPAAFRPYPSSGAMMVTRPPGSGASPSSSARTGAAVGPKTPTAIPAIPATRVDPRAPGEVEITSPHEPFRPASPSTRPTAPSFAAVSVKGAPSARPSSPAMVAVLPTGPSGNAPPEPDKDMALADGKALMKEAEACVSRKEFERAERLCRRANGLEPSHADFLALLAWLEAQRPDTQGEAETRARIVMLDRAVRLDRECERAYFYRAQLFKRVEDGPSAVRDFRIASRLNPHNIDAAREVRLYEMRARKSGEFDFARRASPASGTRGPESGSSPNGFLDKFLKK